jgi:adenosylhomocysteine nucleosidase
MVSDIGVICAIAEERAALARTFGLGDAGEGPFALLSGRAHGIGVHLAQAGIGKANVAALTAHMLTLHPRIGLIAFCGVAGGMHDGLDPGDLVIGGWTATHDYGAMRQGRLDWFPAGDMPLGPSPAPAYQPALAPDLVLDRAIADFAAPPNGSGGARRTVVGRIISGDVFLNCRSTRDRLHAAWDCDAIDMESAAFAETARKFGVATLILRTISDRACEESHLSFQQMADAAAANSADFLGAYLARLAQAG